MSSPIQPLPENDQDNADLLIQTHGDKIRYVIDAEAWYVWNGKIWEFDNQQLKLLHLWTDIAQQMPKHIQLQNPQAGGPTSKPNAHRKYSLSAQGSKNVEIVARRNTSVHIRMGELDARPYELNTPNGIVNLRTAKLLAPNALNLHTRQSAVSPKEGPAKRWHKFLKETFQGDDEMIEYMQRLMGMAIIGKVVEQVFPFAWGPAGTGKSTFFNVIAKIMGDYAAAKSSQLLMKGSSSLDQRFASLQGVRLCIMSELNEGSLFDEATLKTLTGNDVLEGRHLYQKSFSFDPSHTLFLFGNFKPSVKESGQGVWRRMRLLPFTNLSYKRTGELQEVLIEQEGAQILQWLIEGTRKYLESGLPTSTAVLTTTMEYESEEDSLGQFIDEMCIVDPSASVSGKEFRHYYVDWCNAYGYHPYGIKQLTQRLTTQGKYGNIVAGRLDSRTRGFKGIKINQSIRV